MKTRLVIEIESKDKLMAKLEPGAMAEEKDNVEQNIAEDFHKELVGEIKKHIKTYDNDFPEGIEDNYIEGFDEPEDYGLSTKIIDENDKNKKEKKQ